MVHKLKYTRIFHCKILIKSIALKNIKLWVSLLPLRPLCIGLSPSIKRFTLLRSPLGNKKAKDQYQRCEYRYFLYFKSSKPAVLLAFLDSLKYPININMKISVSTTWY